MRSFYQSRRGGFTLIELSIVLVIIGLLIGGMLVGRDLIRAAEVRATISQIEKYNAAVNTFRGKYDGLPGDLAAATSFGFAARGSSAGQGDGNGLIEGWSGSVACGYCEAAGETSMFWKDLSAARLIEGGFTAASATALSGSLISGSGIAAYLPPSKLGGENYVYVYSDSGINYYGVSLVGAIAGNGTGAINSNANLVAGSQPSIPVIQAYNIDRKIDDGLPFSGNVTVQHLDAFAATGPAWTPANTPTLATPATTSTCFDNGNNFGVAFSYSIKTNGGAGANCALSFRSQ